MRIRTAATLFGAAMLIQGNIESYRAMYKTLEKGYRGQKAEMMADCEGLTIFEYPFIMPGRKLAKVVYRNNHP